MENQNQFFQLNKAQYFKDYPTEKQKYDLLPKEQQDKLEKFFNLPDFDKIIEDEETAVEEFIQEFIPSYIEFREKIVQELLDKVDENQDDIIIDNDQQKKDQEIKDEADKFIQKMVNSLVGKKPGEAELEIKALVQNYNQVPPNQKEAVADSLSSYYSELYARYEKGFLPLVRLGGLLKKKLSYFAVSLKTYKSGVRQKNRERVDKVKKKVTNEKLINDGVKLKDGRVIVPVKQGNYNILALFDNQKIESFTGVMRLGKKTLNYISKMIQDRSQIHQFIEKYQQNRQNQIKTQYLDTSQKQHLIRRMKKFRAKAAETKITEFLRTGKNARKHLQIELDKDKGKREQQIAQVLQKEGTVRLRKGIRAFKQKVKDSTNFFTNDMGQRGLLLENFKNYDKYLKDNKVMEQEYDTKYQNVKIQN